MVECRLLVLVAFPFFMSPEARWSAGPPLGSRFMGEGGSSRTSSPGIVPALGLDPAHGTSGSVSAGARESVEFQFLQYRASRTISDLILGPTLG